VFGKISVIFLSFSCYLYRALFSLFLSFSLSLSLVFFSILVCVLCALFALGLRHPLESIALVRAKYGVHAGSISGIFRPGSWRY